jgi:hypothetical protein
MKHDLMRGVLTFEHGVDEWWILKITSGHGQHTESFRSKDRAMQFLALVRDKWSVTGAVLFHVRPKKKLIEADADDVTRLMKRAYGQTLTPPDPVLDPEAKKHVGLIRSLLSSGKLQRYKLRPVSVQYGEGIETTRDGDRPPPPRR